MKFGLLLPQLPSVDNERFHHDAPLSSSRPRPLGALWRWCKRCVQLAVRA